MWQFMPFSYYGLKRNAYVDERFDPEKSTRAYARYMKFLYDQLGDWYLAMAAYDHGAGNIQHEVAKTGYADFLAALQAPRTYPPRPRTTSPKSSPPSSLPITLASTDLTKLPWTRPCLPTP